MRDIAFDLTHRCNRRGEQFRYAVRNIKELLDSCTIPYSLLPTFTLLEMKLAVALPLVDA